jgi:hypothetical protein
MSRERTSGRKKKKKIKNATHDPKKTKIAY